MAKRETKRDRLHNVIREEVRRARGNDYSAVWGLALQWAVDAALKAKSPEQARTMIQLAVTKMAQAAQGEV